MQIEASDINDVMLARKYIKKTISNIESKNGAGLVSDLKGSLEDLDEWLGNAMEMTF